MLKPQIQCSNRSAFVPPGLRMGNLKASKRPACTPALPANASDPPKPTMVVKHDTSFLSRRTLLQQAGLAAMLYQMSAMSDAAKAVDGEDNYDDAAVREVSSEQLLLLSQRIGSLPPTQRSSPLSPRLIDVRTPKEYQAGHVANTINVSYTNDEEFEKRILPVLESVEKSAVIVLICASTKRSIPAVKVLQHAGYKNAVQLAKGMQGNILPLEKQQA